MDRKDHLVVDKYLNIYAESYADHMFERDEFAFVLVIPAYREGRAFIESIATFALKHPHALIIVVINAPDTADAARDNVELLANLRALGTIEYHTDTVHVVKQRNGSAKLMLIGPLMLPRREGVGRARKIGCDTALALMRREIITTPILFSTDADAQLPRDYFLRCERLWRERQDFAGFIFPYIHERPKDPLSKRAIELYEMRLNAYVAGLMHARSPYAFHTVGSTIALTARAYAQARGFPKIAAGEDFYLLNKIAKLGGIVQMEGDPIRLSARLSTRVPFGTGPALIRIREDGDRARIFYHPAVFEYLKSMLAKNLAAIAGIEFHDDICDSSIVDEAAYSLRGYETLHVHLALRRSITDRVRAFHDWFDAFRTLKFIHFLRDKYFPMRSFDEQQSSL